LGGEAGHHSLFCLPFLYSLSLAPFPFIKLRCLPLPLPSRSSFSSLF
jgi:hypothetical protein